MNPVKPDRGTIFGAGWKARRDKARLKAANQDKLAEIRAIRAAHYAAQAAAVTPAPEPAPQHFDMRPEEERKANPLPAPEPAPVRKGRAKKVESTDDGAIFEE
jgi:hypothetical protein